MSSVPAANNPPVLSSSAGTQSSKEQGRTEVQQAPPGGTHTFSFDFRSVEPPQEPELPYPLFHFPLQTIKGHSYGTKFVSAFFFLKLQR